jgi:nucleolar protein 12
LVLEETKLKFAKRKLRVQRCKTLPGSKISVTAKPKRKEAHAAIVVPKGDPLLGEQLAGLSKDERKQRKSMNAERVARRLAKKKARMALDSGIGLKSQGKDRERVRKTTGQCKPSGGKKSRGRIRSAESTAKKNTKK